MTTETRLRRLDRALAGSRPFLLVGEAPNDATRGRPELWLWPDDSGIRHSANRLLEISGLTREQYVRTFDRDNLLDEMPRCRTGGGYRFDVREARVSARLLVEVCAEKKQPIVVLGIRAMRAFEVFDAAGATAAPTVANCATWRSALWDRDLGDVPIAHVPHPSGISRAYNDPATRLRVRSFLRTLAGVATDREDQ